MTRSSNVSTFSERVAEAARLVCGLARSRPSSELLRGKPRGYVFRRRSNLQGERAGVMIEAWELDMTLLFL